MRALTASLARRAKDLLTHLLALVVVVALLSAAVRIADAMGWEGRWTDRTLFLGLVLLLLAGTIGLEAGWRRLRHGPRPPVTPRHAAAPEQAQHSQQRTFAGVKEWLRRSTFG